LIRTANAAELARPNKASLASSIGKALAYDPKPGLDDVAEAFMRTLAAQRDLMSPTHWIVTAFGSACFERAQATWAPLIDRPILESDPSIPAE
jgi:hypothetical protein